MGEAVDMDEYPYHQLAAEPPAPAARPGRRPPITAAHVFTRRLIHRAMIRHVRPNEVPTALIRFGIMPFLEDDLPVTAAPDWRLDHDAINWCVAICCVVFGIINIAICACAVAAPQPAGQAIPSSDHYFLPADAVPPFNRSVLVAVDEQFATTILHPWLLACASILALGSLGLLAVGSAYLFLQCRIWRALRHTFVTPRGTVACAREVRRMDFYGDVNFRCFFRQEQLWDSIRRASQVSCCAAVGVLVCTVPLLNWSAGGRYRLEEGKWDGRVDATHGAPSATPDLSSSCPAAVLQFGHVVGDCLPQSDLLRRDINEHWRPPKWTCPSHRPFLLVPDDTWNSFNFSQPDREWCVSPCQLDARGEVWSALHYQNATYRWPCVAAIPQLECVSIWICALWGFAFIVISTVVCCIGKNRRY